MHRVGYMLPQDQVADLSLPPSYPRTLANPLAGQACQDKAGCPARSCRSFRGMAFRPHPNCSSAAPAKTQMCRYSARASEARQIWMTQRAHIQEAEAHASKISSATATAYSTPFMHSCTTLTGSKLISCSSRAVVDPSAYVPAALAPRLHLSPQDKLATCIAHIDQANRFSIFHLVDPLAASRSVLSDLPSLSSMCLWWPEVNMKKHHLQQMTDTSYCIVNGLVKPSVDCARNARDNITASCA